MNVQLVQFSIVVSGQSHNPTLLNPDFLAIHDIVPQNWGWELAPDPFTTPPLAQVRYTNGVSITVQHNKLQVVDLRAGDDPTASKASEIVRAYVTTLPHVRYTAVGINFQTIVEISDPQAYLKNRFLKAGPWEKSAYPISAVGLRLVYPLAEHGRLVLSLDAGEVESVGEAGKEMRKVVIANANFHRDCQGYPAAEQVKTYLSHVSHDWSMYQTVLDEAVLKES
jgi:hypothetical protein